MYCLFSAIVLKKYGKFVVSSFSDVEKDPSALYVMTTDLTCFETPAIGSTVSEHAGPEMKKKNIDTINALQDVFGKHWKTV